MKRTFRNNSRLWLVLSIVCLGACRDQRSETVSSAIVGPAGEKLIVYTVNYPLQYFAEQIGGELVEARLLVPRDVDPAYWEPSSETIAEYQQADLILANGAGFARWMSQATLPESKIVNTSESVADKYVAAGKTVSHRHGPEGEHTHRDVAITTWLDPQLALAQAKAVEEAMKRLRPDDAPMLEANFDSLADSLNELDRELESALATNEDGPVLASHPVYQYLARRYGMNVRSFHWEPHELPDEQAWDELRATLENHQAEWMLWESPPNAEIVARLKEVGVKIVVFDPCANAPADGDYIGVMSANVRNLREALGAKNPE